MSEPYLSAFAIDSENAYWTNLGGPEKPCTAPCTGTVKKMPLAGGNPVTLASGQASPGGIAVEVASVVWTNSGDSTGVGTVMKMPVGGGSPVVLVSGPSPQIPITIAVDAKSAYWTNMGNTGTPCTPPCGVMSVPLTGGSPVMLAPGMFGVVDGADIYWAGVDGLMKMRLPAGSPVTFVSGAPADPVPFAVGADGLYWVGINTLWKVPASGGKFYGNSTRVSPLGPALDPSSHEIPSGIAVDTTSVYWTNTDNTPDRSGTVMKLPIGGGTLVVLASGQSKPSTIVVDAMNVYWLTTDASTNIGAIMKMPLDGGSACQACVGALDGAPP